MEQRLRKMIEAAVNHRATDVHFQIRDRCVHVQMRKDGKLIDFPDAECDLKLFRYLQYRSNMELSKTGIPQTGRFDVDISDRKVSLRFALIHSFQMTSGVLRILNAENTLTIDSVFLYPEHAYKIKQAFHRGSGLILLSGPTGSGKTTTLYTCLKSVNDRRVFTVEDPIEVYDESFVQLQINEAQNLDYEASIRQLMRHDPDIIMIGEIRDAKAAKGAVQSALTGHLVAATIHASSCIMAIERMKELGISEMLLKDVLCLVSSQRLLSTIRKEKACAFEMMDLNDLSFYFAKHQLPASFHDLQTNVRWLEKQRIVSTFETEQMYP